VRILFLVIITGAQALVNHMGIGLTAKLTDFSGYLIFASAIALIGRCLPDLGPVLRVRRLVTFANYSGEAGGNVWPAVSNALGVPARPAAADLHHHRL
jgi:amino acid transporter